MEKEKLQKQTIIRITATCEGVEFEPIVVTLDQELSATQWGLIKTMMPMMTSHIANADKRPPLPKKPSAQEVPKQDE